MIERLKNWFWKEFPTESNESLNRLQTLEKIISLPIREGHRHLFLKALRHRSIVDGDKYESHETYERLEFLGDAVLDLIVTEILYEKYPTENEGFLTKLRAKIVRGDTLYKLAMQLRLNEVLEVGERAAGQGIELSKSVLSDVFEALIAAFYISYGYEKVYCFVLKTIEDHLDIKKIEKKIDNHKSLLMEYSQSERLPLPRYEVLSEKGPGHDKTFNVAVYISDKKMGHGIGKSKKEAEQKAAKMALEKIVKQKNKNNIA